MSNTNAMPTTGSQGATIAGGVPAASVIDPAKRAEQEALVKAAMGAKYGDGEPLPAAVKSVGKKGGKKGVVKTDTLPDPLVQGQAPAKAYAAPKAGDLDQKAPSALRPAAVAAVTDAPPSEAAQARFRALALGGADAAVYADIDERTLDIAVKLYAAFITGSPGAFAASVQATTAQNALRHALNIVEAVKRHPGFKGLSRNSVY